MFSLTESVLCCESFRGSRQIIHFSSACPLKMRNSVRGNKFVLHGHSADQCPLPSLQEPNLFFFKYRLWRFSELFTSSHHPFLVVFIHAKEMS